VGDEPGNLPLLEHALLQLWERRQGNTITHKACNDIESLSGALKNHADRVHDELKDRCRILRVGSFWI
jgi:Novel STAND NTPase 1